MNRSTPGLPVHHQLPEFTETDVHRVSNAIQPSHPLPSPSPPAPNPSQHPNQSILKEISPGISLEGMMLKLKLQYFGHLMRRVDSLEIYIYILIYGPFWSLLLNLLQYYFHFFPCVLTYWPWGMWGSWLSDQGLNSNPLNWKAKS